MTEHREAKAAVGSGSGRVSRPVPEDGHRVASDPAVRADMPPAGDLTQADSVAQAAQAAMPARVAATGQGDPPAPRAHVRGSPAPAVARSARGRTAGTTASAAPGTTEAGSPVRSVPGGTPPRDSGLRGPGRIARPPSDPHTRRRAVVLPNHGRITAPHSPGEISPNRCGTPGPSHGTNRAPIPATKRPPSTRRTASLSLGGWSRMHLPSPWRQARPCRPDPDPAVPRMPAAPEAPEARAVPRKGRVALTSATGRTTRDARRQ